MFKPVTLFIALLFSILLLYSCGNSEKQADNDSGSTSGSVDELTQFKYDKLISNVPIPFDILRAHTEVPLAYNPEALNSTSSLPHYASSSSRALNLGIYGGDLAYCITYEKFEDMGSFLKCAKKLADDLGIPIAFDQRALSAYREHGTNKDSLERIVFSSYNEVDKTLKSNERIGLASLVVTGGWIEGLYATLKSMSGMPKDEKSKNLYKKVGEQKNHLNMIIGLLEQFRDEIVYVNLVMDLHGIKSIYDTLSDKSEISEAELVALAEKVTEVRNKIVTP